MLRKRNTGKNNRTEWQIWLRTRRAWLKSRREKNGTLTCEYCGRTGLKLAAKRGEPIFDVATVDHVRSLAIGGERFDPRNFAVSCRKCNAKKGVGDYTEILADMRMKKNSPAAYLMLFAWRMLRPF